MAGKILITPHTGSTSADPTIVYQGSGSIVEITQRVTSLGVLSFEGIAGTLLQVTNAANGSILIGTSTDNGVDKLQVNGSIKATNLIGVNTGDETATTIKTKLSITTLSGSNTGDQTITLTGDVTGTGTGSFAATLAASGVVAGSYTLAGVTVDSKGRVIAVSNGTIGNAPTATTLQIARTINGVAFDGSTNIAIGTPSPYYDITNFTNGKPLVNEILIRVIAVRAFNLAANCAGSYAYCTTPATASFQLALLKNGGQFGTVTFAIGSTTGTFSSPAATFNISDQFAVRCLTGAQDSTLSDIAMSFLGTA